MIFLILLTSLNSFAADFNEAYQREYVYVASQKEALLRQQSKMEQNFKSRLEKLKGEVGSLQVRLTRLTASHDAEHDQLVELEKRRKELERRGTSLKSTFNRAAETLATFETELNFQNEKIKAQPAPLDLEVATLEPLFSKAKSLLETSAKVATFSGQFVDGENNLKTGEITRIGRVAAFVKENDARYALGPNGDGGLKILERVVDHGIYIFDDLKEAAHIQKAATFLERLADMGPLLFLSMMLLFVVGLFLALVKI